MASRPHTPLHDIPPPSDPAHLSRGYGPNTPATPSQRAPNMTAANDLGTTPGNATDSSPLSQSNHSQNPRFQEEFDASQRGSSVVDGEPRALRRADSTMSNSNTLTPSRGGTLKKKSSLSRKGSLKRSGSRRSSRAGSVRSLVLGDRERYAGAGGDEMNSAFFTPVPTSGNPTDILSNRFQAWRKVLKDLITYFREIQVSYEHRSKALLKVSNVLNNTSMPDFFLSEGGINDALHTLRKYHKQSIVEGNKAKDIGTDVITQLTGLRADLNQKIKEIKNLSGDFKNSVDKEMDTTRKAVHGLQESLGLVDSDSSAVAGKGDPYIVRLGTERQIERQIDEENYLHKVRTFQGTGLDAWMLICGLLKAFLNLEGSGRELESIVVGEIQKAYNAYAGILKREADEAYDTVEQLRTGPIAMPKDREWSSFVERDNHFIDPRIPLRRPEDIEYPGRNHPAASEVRAGMLERKSKYLKSYTPGWYVLSSTHIHEFKSADRINSQPPVMSLYLPEQKLGTHSQPDSSSHKFMLKGRQTGPMHRGHAWTFRAESHDTMLAWYEDLRNLTEKTGEERNAFVRKHARSVSAGSQTSQRTGSISSDGVLDEDEADEVPYSATASVNQPIKQQTQKRPQPGGRFPSDLQVDRGLQATRSASSGSSDHDREIVAAAGSLPGTTLYGGDGQYTGIASPTVAQHPTHEQERSFDEPRTTPLRRETGPQDNSIASVGAVAPSQALYDGAISDFDHVDPQQSSSQAEQMKLHSNEPIQQSSQNASYLAEPHQNIQRHDSSYGEWMAPVATMSGGLGTRERETRMLEQQGGYEAQELGGDSPATPMHAAETPIPISHNTVNDGPASAAPPVILANDLSPADSGTTATTGIESYPFGGGEYFRERLQAQDYMSTATGKLQDQDPISTFPTTKATTTQSSDSNARASPHMPGEYPPTPAA
ncbi:MAG: hypothetical protein M1837_004910 [Sclerophora amabilis]|nr:MAG: hypothetical protein M1837_004910 [Sclerophora amabilis]